MEQNVRLAENTEALTALDSRYVTPTYTDQTGERHIALVRTTESSITGADGKRLDRKIEELQNAVGLSGGQTVESIVNQEIDKKVGNLADLTTTGKSSVVGAVNEVKSKIKTDIDNLTNGVINDLANSDVSMDSRITANKTAIDTVRNNLNTLDSNLLEKSHTYKPWTVGTDLNTYRTPGIYSIGNSTNARLDLHFPLEKIGGFFSVIGKSYAVTQTYYAHTGSTDYVRVFVRHYFQDQTTLVEFWSAWDELISSKDASNENLLINSNFKVNQRGNTSAIGSATINYNFVDRWYLIGNESSSKVSVISEGVRFETVKEAWIKGFCQRIDLPNNYSNQTLTLTAKVKTSASKFGLIIKTTDTNKIPDKLITPSSNWQIVSFTKKLGAINLLEVGIGSNDAEIGYIDVAWVKLEVGKVSTSYTPPKPSEELEKCRYYYQLITCSGLISDVYYGDTLVFNGTFRPMRIHPTSKFKNDIFNTLEGTVLVTPAGGLYHYDFKFVPEVSGLDKNSWGIRASRENNTLRPESCRLFITNGNPICLDAEIY